MLQVTMVGASFRPTEAKEVVKALVIGDSVDLVPDPDNQYDDTAVACYVDDVHIGFIPRDSNSALFEELQSGEEITATVIGFESTLKPVLEIDFGGEDDW